MKATKEPHEILEKETLSVEQLYAVTIWCYENVHISDRTKNIEHLDDGTFSLMNDGEEIKNYNNHGHIKSDLLKVRARELRSVLYVRLISALEVYLIDSIKYAFIKNPYILPSQKKILEVQYSKLIRTDSITDLKWSIAEKETRKLHSGGFKDVVKYYNSQLKISLSDLGINLFKLEKFHDRRHLLVHRMGKTDPSYRHKYNDRSTTIRVSSEELDDLISTIRTLSSKLQVALEAAIANTSKPNEDELFIGEVEFEILDGEFPEILNQDYCFVSKDRFIRNSDLFKIKAPKGSSTYTMQIHCTNQDVALIRSVLKRLKKKNLINVTSNDPIGNIIPRKSDLPIEELADIAKMLPPRNDWKIGIHKDLATILGTSIRSARKIVFSILSDEALLEHLGTNTHLELLNANQSGDDNSEWRCRATLRASPLRSMKKKTPSA